MSQHRNERVVAHFHTTRFDWGEGIAGQATPDKIIQECIEPVTLESLVKTLGSSTTIGGN